MRKHRLPRHVRVGLPLGLVVFLLLLLLLTRVGTGRLSASGSARAATNSGGVPYLDHVVVVMEENHGYSQIIGNSQAPYINNTLVPQGALFTNSHAIGHPSQPNYLDLFSGSNQGITDDSCPHTFSTANLGSELAAADLSFDGYSEDLPSIGYTGCTYNQYARKHDPWINFTNVPTTEHLQFSSFPTDFDTLPTISFIIPNQLDDMHNGTIQAGDTWLQQNLNNYVLFTSNHNSLFIVQFDEDDNLHGNQIVTLFVGQPVVPGQYSESITHFNVLRTLEDMYDLPYAGQSGSVPPITDVWTSGGASPTPTGTPSDTPTPQHTPTDTSTPTPSDTPTTTNTPTPSDTPTPTSTNTSLPTQTPEPPTATQEPTKTPSSTSTPPPSPTTFIASPTNTALPTATACTLQFTDVPSGSTFYTYVRCLACLGIINGYADGTFRPNNNVTRGQLSKIVSNAAGFSDPPGSQLFEDVAPGSTFYDFVYRLASRGYIAGYPCGGPGEQCGPGYLPYYRPNNNATRGQISKIVSNSAGFNDPPSGHIFEDVPPGSAFYTFTQRLASRGVMNGYQCGGLGEPCVPPGNLPYFRPFNNATRGQTSKIVSNTFFPDCNPRRSGERSPMQTWVLIH